MTQYASMISGPIYDPSGNEIRDYQSLHQPLLMESVPVSGMK